MYIQKHVLNTPAQGHEGQVFLQTGEVGDESRRQQHASICKACMMQDLLERRMADLLLHAMDKPVGRLWQQQNGNGAG